MSYDQFFYGETEEEAQNNAKQFMQQLSLVQQPKLYGPHLAQKRMGWTVNGPHELQPEGKYECRVTYYGCD